MKDSCKTDNDCNGLNQLCTRFLWEPKDDQGKTYAYGTACYAWDKPFPCPATKPFAKENMNYAQTSHFSLYT